MDGIISKMNVKKGEKVAQTGTMAGTDLFKIADLSSIQLIVEVSENDILKVSLFDSAVVEIDAYPGRKFKGVVYEIANSPISTSTTVSTDQVTNFEVKIRVLKSSYNDLLENGNQPFRPGMSGSADIQTESEANVLSLPLEAVTLRDDTSVHAQKNKDTYDQRAEVVFVVDNGEAKMRKVSTGIQDNSYIKVEGLKENEEVITGPYSAVSRSLNDGDKVKKSENGGYKPKK
jgi:HlyD family secretion protein